MKGWRGTLANVVLGSRYGHTDRHNRWERERAPKVRIANGQWYCDLCGARLAGVPLSKIPTEERTHVPGKLTRRVLRVDGREVHRCETTLVEQNAKG